MNKCPLKVLREIDNVKGGVMKAENSCDLPRNRRQIYNFKSAKSREKEVKIMVSGIPQNDTLAHVMMMCKETSSQSDAFIRFVEAAPERMCILATNQFDIERFCTCYPSTAMSVDPTFNLCDTNFLQNDRGYNPALLGPILVHQTKTFHPFYYLASSLVRLNPDLCKLKANGTDGELELTKAFKVIFPNAVHLRCMNHLRQNVKDKLWSLGIPQTGLQEFVGDIFGTKRGNHFEHGLIDSESELSFRAALDRIQQCWNNLEQSFVQSSQSPEFHGWFMKYKAVEIYECVLPRMRAKAGLDDTLYFTTNVSELSKKLNGIKENRQASCFD